MIDSLDMRRKNFDGEAVEDKKSIIEISIPVGKFDIVREASFPGRTS